MDDGEILSKIAVIVADVVDLETVELTPGTIADDIEGWDSLAHVRIVVAVEEEFHCKFMTKEITALKCVGDFVALVKRYQVSA